MPPPHRWAFPSLPSACSSPAPTRTARPSHGPSKPTHTPVPSGSQWFQVVPSVSQVSPFSLNIDQHTSCPPLVLTPSEPRPSSITLIPLPTFSPPRPFPLPYHSPRGLVRSAVVQDAMGRFTRAVRAAKGPLTLTAMVRAWNKHARAAVMHVLAASAPPNVCWHAVVGPWHECAADVAHG
ncbi:unnamed protein product [Closterium sp. NIES-65]|nr:unnamed protein product [Closterium sp. NIES-65]